MMIELSELATALRAERGAAEAALGELGGQHAGFGQQVQQGLGLGLGLGLTLTLTLRPNPNPNPNPNPQPQPQPQPHP